MDFLISIVEWLLHFDKHLTVFLAAYGPLTYVVVFIIILCETGLVIAPLLPGDSLLFAVGALAGRDLMNVYVLLVILTVAAIMGDSLNYWIGRKIGVKAYTWNGRWFSHKNLVKTHEFFERHGGKTIIIARFMPIIRTFAPFVAGIAIMKYRDFFFYNVVGGILWVFLFVLGGYFFGSLPIVQENFSIVILGIVAISIVPAVIAWVREKTRAKPETPAM